jgi:phosphonopyruvate decarboxylase
VSYPVTLSISTLQELQDAITEWKEHGNLTFIHFQIAQGSPEALGRPTVKPYEVKERLLNFISA